VKGGHDSRAVVWRSCCLVGVVQVVSRICAYKQSAGAVVRLCCQVLLSVFQAVAVCCPGGLPLNISCVLGCVGYGRPCGCASLLSSLSWAQRTLCFGSTRAPSAAQ
jgi:hypothetical protein